MPQVFLSHSSQDANVALRLATHLREAHVPVWKAPESILPGEEWIRAIERGLNTSTHFLLLQSPAAVDSRWVNFEFDSALVLYMRDRMRIATVDYLPCDVPLFWGRFQMVTGLNDDYDAALAKIQAWLRDETPAHPPRPAQVGTLDIAAHESTYAAQPEMPPKRVMPTVDQFTADIRDALKTYLTNEILNDPGYPLGDEEPLISSGLIDSVSLIDVALWVDAHYGVHIADSQLTARNFDTIAAFAEYIEANR